MGGHAVYVVGKGKTGRFGAGDFKKKRTPHCVHALKGKDIKCFSMSTSHSGAVFGAGEIWMWGEGEYGALGRGNITKQALPMRIVWQRQVAMVACGDNHTLAITEPYLQVFAWGRNEMGQLGTGNTSSGSPVPISVEILSDIRISYVAAGEDISSAISEEGDLYTWGSGQLGTGLRGNPCPAAVHMSGYGDERWAAVVFGKEHAVGTTRSGLVFTWGSNLRGQLGLINAPRVTEKLTPVNISVCPDGVRIIEIAAGGFHSAAIGDNGRAYAWGANSEGQVGNGECDEVQSPIVVEGLLGEKCATHVACGSEHTLVLTAEGDVYSFGNNEKYQLGLGDKKGRLLPEQVILPSVATMVYASGDASAIITVNKRPNGDRRSLYVRTHSHSGMGDKVVPTNLATASVSLVSALSTSLGTIPKSYLDSIEVKRNLRTLPVPVASNGKQETVQKKLSVVITSWNCNSRRREGGLGDWLLEAAGLGAGSETNAPDIIAVGVQEVVKMRTDSVVMATASQMGKRDPHGADAGLHLPWQQDIDRVLIPKGYERIGSKILVGVYLAVYIKSEHMPYLSNVQAVMAPCGVMGKIGNKGAVAIRFTLYNTGFCFICSHLAAGSSHEAVEKRNQDWKTISSRILFPQGSYTIFDHENLFWFGDLNYRIDLSRGAVINLIDSRSWPALQKSDQLNLERLAGRTFVGFKEPPLNFEPTYKYDPGTTIHDTSEKNRTPAWCDRILYRGVGIETICYRRHEILDSDHRPISGTYHLYIETPAPLAPPRAPISALSMHRPPSTPPAVNMFAPSSAPAASPLSLLASSPPSGTFRPLPQIPSDPTPPQIVKSKPLPPVPAVSTTGFVPMRAVSSKRASHRSVPLPKPPAIPEPPSSLPESPSLFTPTPLNASSSLSAPSLLPPSPLSGLIAPSPLVAPSPLPVPSALSITLHDTFSAPIPPPLMHTVVPPPKLRRPRSVAIDRNDFLQGSPQKDATTSATTSATTAPIPTIPTPNFATVSTTETTPFVTFTNTTYNSETRRNTSKATISIASHETTPSENFYVAKTVKTGLTPRSIPGDMFIDLLGTNTITIPPSNIPIGINNSLPTTPISTTPIDTPPATPLCPPDAADHFPDTATLATALVDTPPVDTALANNNTLLADTLATAPAGALLADTSTPPGDTPLVDTPTIDPTLVNTPLADAALIDPPLADTPLADAALVDSPLADTPLVDTPLAATTLTDTPLVDITLAATPLSYTPLADTPLANTHLIDTPLADTSPANIPYADAPLANAPLADAPLVDAPLADAPPANAPPVDAPLADDPLADTPLVDTALSSANSLANTPLTDAPLVDVPFIDTLLTNSVADVPLTNTSLTNTPLVHDPNASLTYSPPLADVPLASTLLTPAPLTDSPQIETPLTSTDTPLTIPFTIPLTTPLITTPLTDIIITTSVSLTNSTPPSINTPAPSPPDTKTPATTISSESAAPVINTPFPIALPDFSALPAASHTPLTRTASFPSTSSTTINIAPINPPTDPPTNPPTNENRPALQRSYERPVSREIYITNFKPTQPRGNIQIGRMKAPASSNESDPNNNNTNTTSTTRSTENSTQINNSNNSNTSNSINTNNSNAGMRRPESVHLDQVFAPSMTRPRLAERTRAGLAHHRHQSEPSPSHDPTISPPPSTHPSTPSSTLASTLLDTSASTAHSNATTSSASATVSDPSTDKAS